jgi:XTP/dITP diphosphohydrolase
MIVYCATSNAGKLREFRNAAGEIAVEPLPGLAAIEPPEETGTTFEENAVLKALYYSCELTRRESREVKGYEVQGREVTGLELKGRERNEWLIAEDSGLEVEALGGAPGVHSARFSGPDATDERNNALLLEKLSGVTQRHARYVAVIALVCDGVLVKTFRGAVEGEILTKPQGDGGFGYDPLFYYPPYKATFAEVPLEQKQKVSHRARALAALFAYLRDVANK